MATCNTVKVCLSFLLLLLLVSTNACAPRQKGAAPGGFFATGWGAVTLAVAPSFSLVSSDTMTAKAPSDVNIGPNASFTYALFSNSAQGPVEGHVHAIFCQLPRGNWRWEMDTWALPQSLGYEKLRAGGKNWTAQLLPVAAERDWFSELWRENGRTPPEFWLAKRWTARPETDIRIVAEYREPAPACMRERLQSNAEARRQSRNAPSLRGKDLLRGCSDELDAFSTRADAAIDFDGLTQAPSTAVIASTPKPARAPDIGKLVGRAEHIDVKDNSFPR